MELLVFLIIGAVGLLLLIALTLGISANLEMKKLQRAVSTLDQRIRKLEDSPQTIIPEPEPLPPVQKTITAQEPRQAAVPPPIPPSPTPREPKTAEPPQTPKPSPKPKPKAPINWEAFMGGKLFAWIGGLALFLGLAFFVRYSFEHNLISPATRVILGTIAGAGLLTGGWFVKRKTYEVTSQTLCATGILTLYACAFASSHAFYGFFSMPVAFVIMAAVTITAFVVAVRLNGQVVAILGLLGGFLTPELLSTGSDHSLALFSYIALLVVGLVAVAFKQRWRHLVLLAAIATIATQIDWAMEHFSVANAFPAMAISLGFEVLFCATFWWNHRSVSKERWSLASAILVSVTALLFSLLFFSYRELAASPGIVLIYVIVADLILLSVPVVSSSCRRVLELAAALTFGILGIYTLSFLKEENFQATLPFFVIFGLIHSGVPVLLQRLHPQPIKSSTLLHQLTPLISLLLVLLPMLRGFYDFSIWPTALIINAILIGVAVKMRSTMLAVGASVFTFVVAAFYITTVPIMGSGGLNEFLIVIAGFGIFFFGAALLLGNRSGELVTNHSLRGNAVTPEALLSVSSGILPFILLVMSTGRLSDLPNPSPIFLVALMLGAMLSFIARRKDLGILAGVALAGVVMVEVVWFQVHFSPTQPIVPLGWFLFFNAAFTALPFTLSRDARRAPLPWAVSALSGILHYFLIYSVIKTTWSFQFNGLVPALMAVPPILILFHLVKQFPDSADPSPSRNSILAWTGGAALFFITLIPPVQFDREWLTVGWALEGTALIWLFHRVPHIGLKAVGVALLAVVFARLTLNPWVFVYHPRSGMPILNWYLWVYGLAAACHFGAGYLLKPPRERLFRIPGQPLVLAGGVILSFYLLNIQIADFYSTGSRISFDFSANFARDMTYSIAWALFAFPLLLTGFWRKLPACRYAGLALMSVTLLKLFLHDLSQLNQLYRIGALLGVAIIVIAASVLYQRFIPSHKPMSSTSPPPDR